MLDAFCRKLEGQDAPLGEAYQRCRLWPDAALRGRVGLSCDNPWNFATAFFRVLECQGNPVLNPTPEDHATFALDSVIDDQGLQTLSPPQASHPGRYFAFSSGSTGERRLLEFSLERALANAQAHARGLDLSEGHLIAQTLRLHHPFGVIAYLLTPLVCGARLQLGIYFDSLLPLEKPWSRPLVVHLTPYHLELLHRRRVTTPCKVEKLSLGAGPIRRQLALYALQLCQQLYTTYGLSEAGPRVTCGRVEADRFVDGWIGYPLEGVSVHLGVDGSLWVDTPYHAESYSGSFDTGDVVERLEDGSLIFKNRRRDVLRVRGQTYPRSLYNQKLEELLGAPCEVCQQPYHDQFIILVEGLEISPRRQQEILRQLPELRGTQWVTLACFERTPLGKVNLPLMLNRLQPTPSAGSPR